MPKPEGPVARRGDYLVALVPHAEAVALVTSSHYAGGAGNTSVYSHGLVRLGGGLPRLVGVALWLPPAAGSAKWVSRFTKGRVPPSGVLTLSRLVVVEGEPKNAAGLLLGQSVRLIAREKRFGALVTFADSWKGHEGTVYKATGWTDTGDTKPLPVWTCGGRVVSPIIDRGRSPAGRRLTTTASPAAMRARGCVLEGVFSKRRFVKVLV